MMKSAGDHQYGTNTLECLKSKTATHTHILCLQETITNAEIVLDESGLVGRIHQFKKYQVVARLDAVCLVTFWSAALGKKRIPTASALLKNVGLLPCKWHEAPGNIQNGRHLICSSPLITHPQWKPLPGRRLSHDMQGCDTRRLGYTLPHRWRFPM